MTAAESCTSLYLKILQHGIHLLSAQITLYPSHAAERLQMVLTGQEAVARPGAMH